MECIKKGKIFEPKGNLDWSKLYAQVPTPIELDDVIRIYYTTRPDSTNGNFVSFTSYIEVDKENPLKVLYIHDKPVIELGEKGTFDEFGIMPSSFIRKKNELWMYYTGWSRELSVPYTTSIGLAISYDNGVTFEKISNGPILSKNRFDPFLVNGPYVQFFEEKYHMWYSSCYKWVENEDKIDPIYKIKHATSEDGINWMSDDFFCIDELNENEAQNAPCVEFLDGLYYMFFCDRSGVNFRNGKNGYKITYAISKDLINWDRKIISLLSDDDIDSWDYEMQAYPRILSLQDKKIILYNGNFFGRKGFGYAELKI